MKRSFMLFLALTWVLSGCMPAFLVQTPDPTPLPDLKATAGVLGATLAAQTMASQPSSTPPPTSTPVIASPTTAVTPAVGFAQTATAITQAVSGTLVATVVSGNTPSPTPTLYARFFGTRPPLVASGRLIMFNRSHAEVYISFQCINLEKNLSILEYPVSKWMEVKIPSGKCDYVAWVGGRQFLGKFSLDTGGQKTIIFFLDRILIK